MAATPALGRSPDDDIGCTVSLGLHDINCTQPNYLAFNKMCATISFQCLRWGALQEQALGMASSSSCVQPHIESLVCLLMMCLQS